MCVNGSIMCVNWSSLCVNGSSLCVNRSSLLFVLKIEIDKEWGQSVCLSENGICLCFWVRLRVFLLFVL